MRQQPRITHGVVTEGGHYEKQTGLRNGSDLHCYVDRSGLLLLRGSKVKLVRINGELEVLGRNSAVKLILAKEFCPVCALLPAEHDDDFCNMRYTKEKQ